MIEPNMRTYLANSTSITGAFYLRQAPQGATLPYGIVFKVSPGKDYTHDGSGLSFSRMQCSCYGGGYQAAKALAGQVISEMEVWPKSSSTTAGKIQTVFLAGEVDLPSEDGVFHVATDFFIWHTH